MSKAAGFKLALAALLLGAAALLLAADQAAPPRLLKAKSHGYSRFEIDPDGNIVEFQTEGVEAEYMGKTFSAFELRYNHATQVVTASGGVTFESKGLALSCDHLRLDGLAGEGVADCPVKGKLAKAGVEFTADSAHLAFPPGSEVLEQKELTATFDGNVTAWKVANQNDSKQDDVKWTLTTAQAVYEGATERLVVPGPVHIIDGLRTLDAQGLSYTAGTREFTASGPVTVQGDFSSFAADSGIADLDLSHAEMTAQSLAGNLTPDGLNHVTAVDLHVITPQIEFAAAQVAVADVTDRAEGAPAYELTAEGAPVHGTFSLLGRNGSFTAQHVLGSLDKQGLNSLSLEESVMITSAEGTLTADRAVLTRGSDGFSLEFPEGLTLGFDLQALTGMEPWTPEIGGLGTAGQ